MKRRSRLSGFEGDFGAHSLRSGFVTQAGKQGVPLQPVMAMTEHRCDRVCSSGPLRTIRRPVCLSGGSPFASLDGNGAELQLLYYVCIA